MSRPDDQNSALPSIPLSEEARQRLVENISARMVLADYTAQREQGVDEYKAWRTASENTPARSLGFRKKGRLNELRDRN